ncbi:MAG: DUF302 domain-containing protein [Chloroflexaceae bacterium]|nr:DUF302 domain-containing protein [Chloroflexaceae bacterium]
MNRALILAALGTSLIVLPAGKLQAENGIIQLKSPYSVEETATRLKTVLEQRGLMLVGTVDHTAAAAAIGQQLRPTRLFIFGNPRAGTPLMQCNQTAAIDLPMKALIWTDEVGQVWLGYNDPSYLQARHGLAGCETVLQGMAQALAAIAQAVTKP